LVLAQDPEVVDPRNRRGVAGFTCDISAFCYPIADDDRSIIVGDGGGHVYFLRLEEPKPIN